MKVSITMKPDKICKGSIRFATDDEEAPITNVYVSKAMEGVKDARSITVTIEVGDSVVNKSDVALLAALEA